MNEKNLTQLALMGLLVASTEATVNATESTNSGFQSGTLLAFQCSSCGGNIAWQPTPSYPSSGSRGCHAYQNQGGYYNQQPQQSSCNIRQAPGTPSGSYSQQGVQRSSCGGGNGSCGGSNYVPGNQPVNPNTTPTTQPDYNTPSPSETSGQWLDRPIPRRSRTTPTTTPDTGLAPHNYTADSEPSYPYDPDYTAQSVAPSNRPHSGNKAAPARGPFGGDPSRNPMVGHPSDTAQSTGSQINESQKNALKREMEMHRRFNPPPAGSDYTAQSTGRQDNDAERLRRQREMDRSFNPPPTGSDYTAQNTGRPIEGGISDQPIKFPESQMERAAREALNRPKYTTDNSYDSMDSYAGMTMNRSMSESELLNQLNAEGKQSYWSLSPQGRAMAINLASQGTDANAAVKEVARQTKAMPSSSGKY